MIPSLTTISPPNYIILPTPFYFLSAKSSIAAHLQIAYRELETYALQESLAFKSAATASMNSSVFK